MKHVHTLVFSLLIISILLIVQCSVALLPLEWRETGRAIYPGYRYSVCLHAEWIASPFGTGVGAGAGFEAGPLRIMVEYVTGLLPPSRVHAVVYVNNEVVAELEGREIYGSGSTDYRFIIECTLDGACDVYHGGNRIASFHIDGPTPYAVFEETATFLFWEARSRVEVRSLGPIEVNTTTTTTAIPPELPNAPPVADNCPQLWASLAGALAGASALAFTLVVLGGAVILLYILYSQVRRRGWV